MMDLFERAARSGINPTFIDGNGQRHDADPRALQSVLDALTRPARTENPHNSAELRLNDDTQRKAFGGDFDRCWILAIQLYGIRSQRNWGIGDFTDLQSVLNWAAHASAAGIGLNPLHALFDDHPEDCSPYSPNSRLFLNSIYIDVEKVPGLPADFAAKHRSEIDKLRGTELVDYVAVGHLKSCALRSAFQNFKIRTSLKHKTDFEAYRMEGGRSLYRFACFEMLRRKYSGPWWGWPAPWSRPDDDALAGLRSGPDADEIEFVEFVQWCAERQLAASAALAEQLGMPVGLYLDVAVGVKADGFDAWNEQIAIARQLSVGAPPDQLNTAGQDWGLAGFNAAGLEERAFTPFRDMLRASMRHAGAIRLDHVLGLNRLYVVPHGYAPHQGVYIQMPFEALLAVASLESMAHRCIVIGEDLGTVPDGFRERLADWAIWSYRVMIFERNEHGDFNSSDRYPKNALVTFSTHDLPTFAGWLTSHDIEVKRTLGIDPGETSEERHQALAKLRAAVGSDAPNLTFESVLSTLSQTPSRLLGVSIEDLLGVPDQTNIPGTVDEHPNWHRRLPAETEAWNGRINLENLRDILKDRII